MSRIRPLQHPPTDNDDVDGVDEGTESREEPVSVVIAEPSSDAPNMANPKDVLQAAKSFMEAKCPFLLHFSSYTLGVLLILCVTVIWVASSNWIQYIFGNLNYSKPYFLTYFNTTGFSFWNMGYYLVPSWSRVPWDDRERPQPILIEDQDVVVDDGAFAFPTSPVHAGARGVGGGFRNGRDRVAGRHSQPPHHHHHHGSGPSTPLSADGADVRYGTDIRVWAADNGYNTSFSSDPSSFSSLSAEELIDMGDLPDLSRAATAAPDTRAAPFLILEARGHAAAGASHSTRRLTRVERVRPYARRKIWFWAALFCPFWFFANYLFNVSLSITSVASNTVLSSTSSIWTLLLSYLLLHESVGPLKWLAIGLCVSGSIMVGISDSGGGDGGTNTIIGDMIALVSAFFYAVYTSILRFGLPDDERYAMGMVFGAVGIINFLCLWPGLVFVDLVGLEKFAWPSAGQFWPLLMNALIGTNLSDVLWARSVVLTSPVVATLGLALTTPLAMIVDAIFKGSHFSAVYVAGAILVMCGFVLVNLPLLERWPRWLIFW